MFAEIGVLISAILALLGICFLFLGSGQSVKIAGGGLVLLGGVTMALQLWIYYKRWHDH